MKGFCLILMLWGHLSAAAQSVDSSHALQADSLEVKVDSGVAKTDTSKKSSVDSVKTTQGRLRTEIPAHQAVPKKSTAQQLPQQIRKWENTDAIFYTVAELLLLFGILKTAFSKYTSTLFSVFFNTSLRQSQLIDQLQQNKLASLLFNLFFLWVGGFYFTLLLEYVGWADSNQRWVFFISSTGLLALVYLIKFLVLSFTGWITGYEEESGIYIFNIFLINKILGICLLPFVVVMAFAENKIVTIALIISWMVIGLLLLMRFVRSYGLLQHRLSFNLFHFLLYVFSLEVLPLMLIYKSIVIFLKGNS